MFSFAQLPAGSRELALWLLSLLSTTPYEYEIQNPVGTALERPLSQQSFSHDDCVHSPHDRGCWTRGFDINADYEVEVPEGKLVEYDFTVSNEVISPDGYLFNATLLNGQFPGPTIEAEWGDTIRITVHNNLSNSNGTSFHWHGIRQLNTNYYDGVPGLTQCPSKPGDTQVYEFRAMQYGTSWYHSHYSLQYSNGALGPIHIKGPSSMNYDVDLGPLLISDWYHYDPFSMFHFEITVHAPLPVGTIVNGKGHYDCDPEQDTFCTGKKKELHEVSFQQGTTYKIGLVNTGSLTTYKFWIDGHNFTVVAADFVPIKPFATDVLILGIAQRYEIIIEANASFEHGTNFWMHAEYCDDDGPFDEMFWDSRIATIRYDESDTSDPYTPPADTHHPHYGCRDPSPTDLVPIVPRQVGREVNGFSPADWLKVGLQSWPNMSDPDSTIKKWVLANRTQYVDWRDPPLARFSSPSLNNMGMPQFNKDEAPVVLDYATGDWVYFVVEGNYSLSSPPSSESTSGTTTPRVDIPRSVHPLHLHGHDFVILAQGDGPFEPGRVVPVLDNPARRDTANVPIGGYLWLAFQINNPGTWLLHCHIAWHASAGLSLMLVEQPGKIAALLADAEGVVPDMRQRCDGWTEHYETVNIPQGKVQEDSGI